MDYGDEKDIDVHIDIELEYGEYLELREDDPAFGYLSRLCGLPDGSDELVLYNKLKGAWRAFQAPFLSQKLTVDSR